MARYKQHGDMLVVDPRPKAVEEVSVRELSRETSSVLARVKAGGRIVMTKHGVPAAVVLEIDEAIGLCGLMLLSRMEAQRRLFGPELDARLRGRIMRRRPRDLEWRKRRRFRA